VDAARGTGPLADDSPDMEHRHLVHAVVAATVGSTVEWYDFLLYSTAAPLVFAPLFFPSRDPLAGLLIAFSTQFVGFAARPLGGVIFGHFGDRVGRKATLIATLLTMGIATATIGVLPGYAQIGVWGGVLLTICRLLQGIGVGGEWAGGVLLSMEWSDVRRRGLIAAWPQIGAPLGGAVLAPSALLIASQVSGSAFLTVGWRIPFLLSLALVVLGLYVRLGVLETPVFSRLLEEHRIEHQPIRSVLSRHRWDVTLTALTAVAEQASAYVFTSFLLAYGMVALRLSTGLMLGAVALGSLVGIVMSPLAGRMGDRKGRRRIYRIGLVGMALWAFPEFWLLNTRVPGLVIFGVLAGNIPFYLCFGTLSALIGETFTGRLRYSGVSVGYGLTSLLAGGPAPIIATLLFDHYGSWVPIAVYVIACDLVSLVAVTLLVDGSRRDHWVEYDQVAHTRLAPVLPGPVSVRMQRSK
jgi:MFS family permease